VYAYLEILYELFERVFVTWKQHVIPEVEWWQWEAWFADVSGHPLLWDVYRDNAGMFDPDFEAFVRSQLPEEEAATAGNPGAA
jgi:hypothetical protein